MAKRVLQGFTTADKDGRKVHYSRGDTVPSNDPIVKGREDLFEDIVEQATKAPGEKRGRQRQQAEPVSGSEAD